MITCGQRTCRTYAGHSRIPLGRSAVSELTVVVVAPGPDCPVRFQCQAEILPGCKRGDSGQAANLHGSRTVGRCPITQLAVSIIAPSPNRPVTFQSDRVVVASRNRDDVR